MSYLCAHSPAYHVSTVLPVLALVAMFAGAVYDGASGGSGTNGLVSGDGPVLFHLRSNWSVKKLKNVASVVNRLCSSCCVDDGEVQFDDPCTTIFWPYRMTVF